MQTVILLMSLGIVLVDLALIIKALALFHRPSRARIMRTDKEYGLLAIFILSTLTVVGTLWFQYGDNLNPCLMCWYQRVFMYPIPVLTLIALIKGRRLSDIADYILALSIIGAAIALYQHLLQILPSGALIPCDSSGDCAIRTVFEFNFVTLPWMAFTIFITIAFISYLARKD
jgi:disulfide bond formation protein DsbB